MRKITKRTLALLLAVSMILGVSTAAAAAAPGKTRQPSESAAAPVPQDIAACALEITSKPTDTTFVIYEERPDLSGLVFKASGGALDGTVTVDYDAVADDWSPAQDKLLWDIWLDWYSLVEGENEMYLCVRAYKCTQFHPVKTVDEVEYGYFERELVFRAETAITMTATPNPDRPGYRVLTLDVPETVTLSERDYDGWSEWYGNARFKFTAPSDGFYAFRSDGGEIGGTLYSKDGDVLEARNVDPWGELYCGDDYWIYDDDGGGDYNFLIYRQMKQGETVTLYTGCWANEEASYTVKVTRQGDNQPVLQLKSNAVRVDFRDFIDINALLEGTGYTCWDVQIRYDYEYVRWWDYYDGLLWAIKNGESDITITAPDGAMATVKVTIDFSAAQWLCWLFLGGYFWLGYTNAGPFNLADQLRLLFDFGVGNSLRYWLIDRVYDLGNLVGDWYWLLLDWLRP